MGMDIGIGMAIVAIICCMIMLCINISTIMLKYYLYKNKRVEQPSIDILNKHRSKKTIASYDDIDIYPSGWYMLCPSFELKIGESKYINALGLDIVLFRGLDKKTYAIYAFCPHLGANLCGGKVDTNCISCPFHKWTFDGTNGECKNIPYDDCDIRNVMHTKSWPVIEYDNMICIYYDNADDNADNNVPVPYELKGVGSVNDMKFGGIKTSFLNMNIQEWVENSADYAHFDFVHDKLIFPILNKLFYAKFEIDTKYIDHYADFNLTTNLYSIWNKKEPVQKALTNIKIWGPGGISYWTFYTPLGNMILIKTVLPFDKLGIKMVDMWYYDKSLPYVIVMYIVSQAMYAFNEDVIIWEKKIYKKNPIIVKKDGPINKFRLWYRKFYKNEFKTNHTW